MGSGSASVGKVVASDSRGPQFESSHRQKFIMNIDCQLYWKDENKEKESENGPSFFKNMINEGGPAWSCKNLKMQWTVTQL